MNIASSVVKFTAADGVNTFVRHKLSTQPISPIQGVKKVEGFAGKMPSPDFDIPAADVFERNGYNHLGRYVDVYA